MKTGILLLVFAVISCNSQKTALDEFTSGNRLFTESLYKELLLQNPENFMTSPLSAQIILALVEEGAKGETSLELKQGLNLPAEKNNQQEAISKIIENLNQESEFYDLLSANKIYTAENLEIKEDFLKISTEIYQTEIEKVDFSDPSTPDYMNQWVESKTEEKIKNLIDPQIIDGSVMIVLINTLYFKANWRTQFNESLTTQLPFTTLNGNTLQVQTMKTLIPALYYEDINLQAKFLRLRYNTESNVDISMTIILPNEKNSLCLLENEADQVFRQNLPLEFKNVMVFLPKFSFETEIDFVDILKNLGINKIFQGGDLSGIFEEGFEVSEVLQKTFINVTESGTEAAAATAVIGKRSLLSNEPDVEFKVDHPFIFYISFNDLILFTGRVTDLSK